MRNLSFLSVLTIAAFYAGAAHSACRTPDLITCMDSVCVTDLTTDPGSRCVLCGSDQASSIASAKKDTYAGAANAPKFQALSLGLSSSLVISERDLRNAPNAPSERYAWAINSCLKKVSSCNADDARYEYDSLIEKSCRAFMSETEYLAATQKVAAEKSPDVCRTEIGVCMTAAARCGDGWMQCTGEGAAAFDRFFASCLIESGCTDNGGEIMAWAHSQSESVIDAIDERLKSAAQVAADARRAKWESFASICDEDSAKMQCVASYEQMFNAALGLPGQSATAATQMAHTICGYVDDQFCSIIRSTSFDFEK